MKHDDVQLQRVYEKPLNVFGKPIRIKRLMLISIVGVVLGVMGYLEMGAWFWVIFAFFNLSFLVFLYVLQDRAIIYLGKNSLEVSASGDLYLTQLHGHCSLCEGHLKIVKKGNEKFIQCDTNKEHVWKTFSNG